MGSFFTNTENHSFNEVKEKNLRILDFVRAGNHDKIPQLKEQGLDLDEKDELGVTALHIAAQNFDTKAIRTLLSQGADVNAIDNEGKTPLHYINDSIYEQGLKPNSKESLILLLNEGADPRIKVHGAKVVDKWQVKGELKNPEMVQTLKFYEEKINKEEFLHKFVQKINDRETRDSQKDMSF